MSASHVPWPLREQIADAFADLWDWFGPQRFAWAVSENWLRQVNANTHDLDHFSRLIEESGLNTPGELNEFLEKSVAGGDERAQAKSAYFVMHYIDRGVRRYHPKAPVIVGPMNDRYDLSTQYASYGRYNTDAVSGYVLPKWTSAFRGQSLVSHFRNLVRANVDRTYARVIGPNSGVRQFGRQIAPTVAVVPFLYVLDEDVTFEGVTKNDEFFYQVIHHDEEGSPLRERVQRAVRELRASGATIGIFPELALSHSLFKLLQQELRATDSQDSQLVWVIVGTYSPVSNPKDDFRNYNTAYVLDSFGNVVGSTGEHEFPNAWIMHKRHRYMLTRHEQETYKLTACFHDSPERDRDEAISVGDHVVVFESSLGCLVVLICEDWAREIDTVEIVRKFNPRVVFVILMDGPVILTDDQKVRGRWAAQKGHLVSDETGTHVVVTNSLILPLRSANGLGGIADAPVGLLIQPQERDAPYPPNEQITAGTNPAGRLVSKTVKIPLLDLTEWEQHDKSTELLE